jgi:hypothetical protein
MLTEQVEVWASDQNGRRISSGHLRIGMDGLPIVHVTIEQTDGELTQYYRPGWFPAAWSLRPLKGHAPELLLDAWQEIDAIRERLKAAEREAEDVERTRAEQREADNRIAEELNEGREEEHVGTAHDT